MCKPSGALRIKAAPHRKGAGCTKNTGSTPARSNRQAWPRYRTTTQFAGTMSVSSKAELPRARSGHATAASSGSAPVKESSVAPRSGIVTRPRWYRGSKCARPVTQLYSEAAGFPQGSKRLLRAAQPNAATPVIADRLLGFRLTGTTSPARSLRGCKAPLSQALNVRGVRAIMDRVVFGVVGLRRDLTDLDFSAGAKRRSEWAAVDVPVVNLNVVKRHSRRR